MGITVFVIAIVANMAIVTSGIPLSEEKLTPVERTRMVLDSPMFTPFNGKYMYQGDMLLSEEQAMQILERKMYEQTSVYWPRNSEGVLNINYVLGDENVNKDTVRKSIAVWERDTCAKFTKLSAAPADKTPHLHFFSGDGCWAYYGTSNADGNGACKVSLDKDGCNSVATGVHEIGHAMGFYHEQCRSDRDAYVKILMENVDPKNAYNFNKGNSINHDIPYDFSSNMHYSSLSFSQGKITIRTINPLYQTVIGREDPEMSFRDAKMFNVAYNCTGIWEEECPDYAGYCENEGYAKMTNGECGCVCPPNTQGEDCEVLLSTYEEAILKKFYPDTGVITAEGKVNPSDYPKEHEGYYAFTKIIRAPKCKNVVVKLLDFNTADSTGCASEFLEIRTDPSNTASGEVLCGEVAWQDKEFKSTANELVLNYHKMHHSFGTKGYQAEVKFVAQENCT